MIDSAVLEMAMFFCEWELSSPIKNKSFFVFVMQCVMAYAATSG